MKLTKNFYKYEFDSKDGSEMPSLVLENVRLLATELQKLRDFVGLPIKVNSGYRSPSHNDSVGGVSNSKHLIGIAADIVIIGFTPEQTKGVIEKLISSGVLVEGGVGIYDTFVHYDTRGTSARWDYRKKKTRTAPQTCICSVLF